jgi:hypothetical protein
VSQPCTFYVFVYLAYDQLKVLVWFFYPKNKKILITKDDDDSISGVLIILL